LPEAHNFANSSRRIELRDFGRGLCLWSQAEGYSAAGGDKSASAKEVLPWLIAKANDRLDARAFEVEGEKATIRRNPSDINKHLSPACEKLEAGAAHFITEEMTLREPKPRT